MKLSQELRKLRALKDAAEKIGRAKKIADEKFKQQQYRCLDRLEIEEQDSAKTYGYLYSKVDKVKGQIEDRKPYVRWALENDEGVCEFLTKWGTCAVDRETEEEFENDFYEAVLSTSVVKYKEDGTVLNGQARAHVDDGAPLPPGATFRPDPYISMKKA